MMQTMTELVEQGDHFVMGKQRRFTIYRAVKVTRSDTRPVFAENRQLCASGLRSHPSTAPPRLFSTGIQVEVEATAQFVVLVIQFEETYIRVPDINNLYAL